MRTSDRLITVFHNTINTLKPSSQDDRTESPADHHPEDPHLTPEENKHIAGLMRINHTGEVCAQALYQGQALTARDTQVRELLDHASEEEKKHLAWCEQRLTELGSRTSHLNPIFYGLSLGMGALTGLMGDKISLGFVAATEAQVCKHLDNHLQEIPKKDLKSRAILEKMREDEKKHEHTAMEAGGKNLNTIIKSGMKALSKVMTKSTYHW